MKYLRNVIFFLFVLIAFISIFINIIVINTSTTINAAVLEKLDGIYLNQNEIQQDVKEEITKLLDSGNTAFFKTLINLRNPVSNFYGFCGFMKSDQKKAFLNFKYNPILSAKEVDIYTENEKTTSHLGYAILLLLNNKPEWLTNNFTKDFIRFSQDFLYEAYKSDEFKESNEYNKLLTDVIVINYQELREKICNEIINSETDSLLSSGKTRFIYFLSHIPDERKGKIINQLLNVLNEDNEITLIATLNNIGNNPDESTIKVISDIILKSNNNKIILPAVEKYSVLLKSRSLNVLKKLMKKNKDKQILLTCLDKIKEYGNYSYYDFLEQYIAYRYDTEIKIAALKTIVATTYRARPKNVINTMTHIINSSNSYIPAKYAIEFHIERNLKKNSGLILSRLRQRESEEMKHLSIRYYKYFKFTNGISLMEILAGDKNSKIKNEAKDLLVKLTRLKEIEIKSAAKKEKAEKESEEDNNIESESITDNTTD